VECSPVRGTCPLPHRTTKQCRSGCSHRAAVSPPPMASRPGVPRGTHPARGASPLPHLSPAGRSLHPRHHLHGVDTKHERVRVAGLTCDAPAPAQASLRVPRGTRRCSSVLFAAATRAPHATRSAAPRSALRMTSDLLAGLHVKHASESRPCFSADMRSTCWKRSACARRPARFVATIAPPSGRHPRCGARRSLPRSLLRGHHERAARRSRSVGAKPPAFHVEHASAAARPFRPRYLAHAHMDCAGSTPPLHRGEAGAELHPEHATGAARSSWQGCVRGAHRSCGPLVREASRPQRMPAPRSTWNRATQRRALRGFDARSEFHSELAREVACASWPRRDLEVPRGTMAARRPRTSVWNRLMKRRCHQGGMRPRNSTWSKPAPRRCHHGCEATSEFHVEQACEAARSSWLRCLLRAPRVTRRREDVLFTTATPAPRSMLNTSARWRALHGCEPCTGSTWNTTARPRALHGCDACSTLHAEHERATACASWRRGLHRFHVEHDGATTCASSLRWLRRFHVEHDGATTCVSSLRWLRRFHVEHDCATTCASSLRCLRGLHVECDGATTGPSSLAMPAQAPCGTRPRRRAPVMAARPAPRSTPNATT
jgi:hypothetical protein